MNRGIAVKYTFIPLSLASEKESIILSLYAFEDVILKSFNKFSHDCLFSGITPPKDLFANDSISFEGGLIHVASFNPKGDRLYSSPKIK